MDAWMAARMSSSDESSTQTGNPLRIARDVRCADETKGCDCHADEHEIVIERGEFGGTRCELHGGHEFVPRTPAAGNDVRGRIDGFLHQAMTNAVDVFEAGDYRDDDGTALDADLEPYLRAALDSIEALVSEERELSDCLDQALWLTREYIGPQMLPAKPGWPWFDAGERYRKARDR